MKTLVTLIIVLMTMSMMAQEPAPKKAWKILIKNNLTAEENFTLVGRTLADNDFTIEYKDKEFFTIKTNPRELGKISGRYFLNFSIRDKVISVTGQANIDISISFGSGVKSEAAFGKIINKGMGGSFDRIAFTKMQDFALSLGKDVEYIID